VNALRTPAIANRENTDKKEADVYIDALGEAW